MNRSLAVSVGVAVVLCAIAVFFFAQGPLSDMVPAFSSSSTSSLVISNENDFTPPTERLDNANPVAAGARQLLLATSADGVTFTATGERLTAQAGVPDAVVSEDGTLFVYYIGQSITEDEENTVVATSDDNGATWTYRLLTFKNLPSPREPSDPDVVLLPDGTFRMFYTDSINQKQLGIRYADSPDGITFTYGGIALEAPFTVIDSTTFFFDGVWTMLVLDFTQPKQYRATSTDGKTFTYQGEVGTISTATGSYFLSNPLIEDGTLRMFGFSDPSQPIYSFTSPDTMTWTAATSPALKRNALSLGGGTYLQDLTVAKLSDGTYLMVYVTDMAQ